MTNLPAVNASKDDIPMTQPRVLLPIVLLCTCFAVRLDAADWPQFMRYAQRTGDAADEELQFPLMLAAQIKLDDAMLTSPAVVGGRAYAVDQMGTAYCIDPDAQRIVWKVSPDGDAAKGSNTSSPCVFGGRVYYGTTAGNFHILDAKDGTLVKTVDFRWPITAF